MKKSVSKEVSSNQPIINISTQPKEKEALNILIPESNSIDSDIDSPLNYPSVKPFSSAVQSDKNEKEVDFNIDFPLNSVNLPLVSELEESQLDSPIKDLNEVIPTIFPLKLKNSSNSGSVEVRHILAPIDPIDRSSLKGAAAVIHDPVYHPPFTSFSPPENIKVVSNLNQRRASSSMTLDQLKELANIELEKVKVKAILSPEKNLIHSSINLNVSQSIDQGVCSESDQNVSPNFVMRNRSLSNITPKLPVANRRRRSVSVSPLDTFAASFQGDKLYEIKPKEFKQEEIFGKKIAFGSFVVSEASNKKENLGNNKINRSRSGSLLSPNKNVKTPEVSRSDHFSPDNQNEQCKEKLKPNRMTSAIICKAKQKSNVSPYNIDEKNISHSNIDSNKITMIELDNKSLKKIDIYSLVSNSCFGNIKVLSLRHNKFDSLETLNLSILLHLTDLDLAYNELKGILPLNVIPPSIVRLDISHNFVTSIEHLLTCIHIRTLNISNNFLKKLRGIHPSLEHLDASDNQLSDPLSLRYLSIFPNLVAIGIAGNPIISTNIDWRINIASYCPKLLEIDGKLRAGSKVRGKGYLKKNLNSQKIVSTGHIMHQSLNNKVALSDFEKAMTIVMKKALNRVLDVNKEVEFNSVKKDLLKKRSERKIPKTRSEQEKADRLRYYEYNTIQKIKENTKYKLYDEMLNNSKISARSSSHLSTSKKVINTPNDLSNLLSRLNCASIRSSGKVNSLNVSNSFNRDNHALDLSFGFSEISSISNNNNFHSFSKSSKKMILNPSTGNKLNQFHENNQDNYNYIDYDKEIKLVTDWCQSSANEIENSLDFFSKIFTLFRVQKIESRKKKHIIQNINHFNNVFNVNFPIDLTNALNCLPDTDEKNELCFVTSDLLEKMMNIGLFLTTIEQIFYDPNLSGELLCKVIFECINKSDYGIFVNNNILLPFGINVYKYIHSSKNTTKTSANKSKRASFYFKGEAPIGSEFLHKQTGFGGTLGGIHGTDYNEYLHSPTMNPSIFQSVNGNEEDMIDESEDELEDEVKEYESVASNMQVQQTSIQTNIPFQTNSQFQTVNDEEEDLNNNNNKNSGNEDNVETEIKSGTNDITNNKNDISNTTTISIADKFRSKYSTKNKNND
jgi:hypothetical protein